MSIKRILKRISEELRATKEISKITSFGEGINTFLAKIDIQRMNRNGYKESSKMKKRLLKKHKTMMNYFKKKFEPFLSTYKVKRSYEFNESLDNVIWLCWWQGEDNAPDIVKNCIDSIRKNSGEHEVIIINKDNYKNYVSIPEWIEEKRNKGIITWTHMSDILRLSLLSKYGGMWLDTTFFCNGSLDEYFSYDLWSIKRPDYLHCSIASGYFATYSLYVKNEYKWIFSVILDMYLHYWSITDSQIDYLTLDYMFVLAQEIDPDIKKLFNSIPENNPECDELCKILNLKYDLNTWNKLCYSTKLFKLTWKQKFKTEHHNKKTYFSHIMQGDYEQ